MTAVQQAWRLASLPWRAAVGYSRWLHTRWPAGAVEKLPEVRADGTTNVPGLFVVGDLRGVPLLKLAADSGARAVRVIVADPRFVRRTAKPDVLDLAIVGAGVSGMSAALEARKEGLRFEVVEAAEPFATIVNFPRAKPIFTYPAAFTPAGELQFGPESSVKEGLLQELRQAVGAITPRTALVESVRRRADVFELELRDQGRLRAHRVIVAIGRSGSFRKLGVPGEDRDKVFNRLHDPKDFSGQDVLVVGGGDASAEAAIALTGAGARVVLSYRGAELARPKQENVATLQALSTDPSAQATVERPVSKRITTAVGPWTGAAARPGSLRLLLGSRVREIRDRDVVLEADQRTALVLPNDAVFVMIGREAPLELFRRCGVSIVGEMRARRWVAFAAFVLFCAWLYHWKGGEALPLLGPLPAWLSPDPARLWTALAAWGSRLTALLDDPKTLLGTLRISASSRSFYYTLAYTLVVAVFGWRRIRRRRTAYVRVQTLCLMTIQALPLFILPEIVLPYLGHRGWFDHGSLRWLADQLFPVVAYGHGREYWRAYGFVLAWPLMVYNWFTARPLLLWWAIGAAQTFVAIPWLVHRFGKGAYCGWLCSCGALAETLGDAHRHKMPHGPRWNRVNLVGQAILAWALALAVLRAASWVWPGGRAAWLFTELFERLPLVHYGWFVDLFLAGIVGYGAYFWFSGRVWCRFACPLAALMHIYARFSRFRILPDKKKCISCNVCTSVCHQGIDVMSFANKGLPMADPECVRCSACVEQCPTGVLTFGQIDRRTQAVVRTDPEWLWASSVRQAEASVSKKIGERE